ncbi:MAG: hypothetical protein AAGC73_02850 [Verrucomicrobiota bacterium]
MPICLLLSVILSSTNVSFGALYDWAENGGENRLLRLNIPDSIGTGTVRGLLIYANTYQGNSINKATDAELVAFASGIDFAVLATAEWYNFSEPDDAELLLFETALAELANDSGHPELANAPWLPVGFSNGGQFSYGLAAKRPEMVIAFVVSKGCCYSTFSPGEATRKVPGLLIAGENDTTLRRDNIHLLYSQNRALGALWSWVEEEATGHTENNEEDLKLPFLAEAYRLRYPEDQSPANGTVTLNELNPNTGWLVDQTTWGSGYTDIYPYTEIDDDPSSEPTDYGWVLNEKIARLYRSFASRLKVTNEPTGTNSPVAISTTVSYSPDLTNNLQWSEIDNYVDGHLLSTTASGSSPTDSIDFTYGGLYAFHSVITLSNGSKRVSQLNRVYIEGTTPSNRFENWLYDRYKPADHFAGALDSNGYTAIETYAFDLDTSLSNFPQIQSPAVYQFTQRSDLEGSGVLFEVRTNSNLLIDSWSTLTPDDPSYSLSYNVVTVDLSAGGSLSNFAKTILTEASE